MKKTRLLLLMAWVLLSAQLLPFLASAQDTASMDTSITNGCRTFDGQVPLYGSDQILETAQAAMLYEVDSGTVMYAWNPDAKIPPASLVKIMTCLLVLENCDVSEKVVVTQSAMDSISETSATLSLLSGEEFTVDQLLYGLMVGSANDAAVVLAEHVAGSQEAFVALMNQRAKELGCVDTWYVNAHGLHDDAQVTTARDVVRLVAAAMESEHSAQFMEYFGKTSYQLPATSQSGIRRVETTNYLMTIGTELYYDARVTGGRTGITTDGDRSIVATAQSGSLNYIAVVLAATPSYNDEGVVKRFGSYEEAKELLAYGFESHSMYQVLFEGQILGQFNVTNGKNAVAVGPVNSMTVALPAGTTVDELTIRYGNMNGALEAPIEAGQEISSVEVWYGSVCVGWSPIVALNGSKVNSGSALQENRYGGSSKLWVYILIVLLVAALAAGGWYLLRRTFRGMQDASVQRRYRRRRSDRRRTK